MFSRPVLIACALVAISIPAWAFNGDEPGRSAGASSVTNPDPTTIVPGTAGCAKSKRQLTPEQKAERKAAKAQRTAQQGAASQKARSAKPKC